MCELLGISSHEPLDVKPYLEAFLSHSQKFPHGWGLLRSDEDVFGVIKEPVAAYKSEIAKETLNRLAPQNNIVAHIRFATIGSIKTENCHPFCGKDSTGREWTVAHNGTVYSGKYLTKYLGLQQGDTDSEKILLFIIDEVNKAQSQKTLSARKRFDVVDEAVRKLSHRNKLNLLIFDGELLYVHKNMNNSLCYKHEDNSFIFSTTPLDDGVWEDFPLSQLFAFHNGKKVFRGHAHNEIFVPNLNYANITNAINI